MISAGIEGRLSYMTYPEPWGGPPKQPPEFLRPAPKPLSQTSKYNSVSINTGLNGARLISSQRPLSSTKYAPPSSGTPVNLTSASAQQQLNKDEQIDDLSYSAYSQLFAPPQTFSHYHTPYAIYQSPYTPLMRPNFVPPPPLSPLEAPPYTPTIPSASATTGATFLSPSTTFNPPVLSHTVTQHPVSQQQIQQLHIPVIPTARIERRTSPGFKVPSGKEGSLKHRILTRPGEISKNVAKADIIPTSGIHVAVSSQLPSVLSDIPVSVHGHSNRKRLSAVFSPPSSPVVPTKASSTSSNVANVTVNNNVLPTNGFVKGALIQLASGELRRIEDMQTEDFVQSAEQSPDLRLADSTVVRIEDSPKEGTVVVTLTYNQRRTKVKFESSVEYPFFVYGRGWASFAPERTLQIFGLKVHRLQVGDVLISLTPRESSSSNTSSIVTTATTTAPTPRPIQPISLPISRHEHQNVMSSLPQSTSNNSNGQNNTFYSTPQSPSIYHSTSNNSTNSSLINLIISNSNLRGGNSHTHIVSNQRQVNSQSQPNQALQDVVESEASKKRRWSAPDEICDEDERTNKRVKLQ